MKKTAVNILCTTGLTLILLAAVGIIFNARFLCIESVFQSAAVNIIIHIGLKFTRKFESSYTALEYALDIGWITATALIFGMVFDWYASVPVWVLTVMALAVYFVSVMLSLVRANHEIIEINKLLQSRTTKGEE